MFRKSLFAAALVIAGLAFSSASFAGQAYQGGPKSGASSIRIASSAQPFEANKPYAQAVEERKGRHVYQGGPWTNIPMATH